MTEKQKRFADEYLIDLNATRAYKAAYPNVKKDETAAAAAARMLRNVKVKNYVDERIKDREKRTEITQDNVLKILWDIATADPNEIINLSRVCCRHCYGAGFHYQWINEQEFERAVDASIMAKVDKPLPLDIGGYGFTPKRKPNPDCPYCFGDGHMSRNINDTNELSERGKALYAGFKETQAGLEIKMKDQMKALELVGRHLGMFTDKIEHSGGVALNNPFAELTKEQLLKLAGEDSG